MRYATWKIDFSDNPLEGTGPEYSITTGKLEGGLELSSFYILGYATDDSNLSNLEKWKVTEITQQQALDLALSINNNCFITDSGRISVPLESEG